MTVKEFREKLKKYEVNDHGYDADILFYMPEEEEFVELELIEQSDDDNPGFEEGRAMCSCFWGLNLNFRKKDN
jgi:hypothetical protein